MIKIKTGACPALSSVPLLACVALEVNVGRQPEAGHCRKAEVLGPGCLHGAGGRLAGSEELSSTDSSGVGGFQQCLKYVLSRVLTPSGPSSFLTRSGHAFRLDSATTCRKRGSSGTAS